MYTVSYRYHENDQWHYAGQYHDFQTAHSVLDELLDTVAYEATITEVDDD